MRLTNLFFFLISISLIIQSCGERTPCIIGPDIVTVGEAVTYTACDDAPDAKSIQWRVFDGLKDTEYEGESITVTFDNPTQNAVVYQSTEGGFLRSDSDESSKQVLVQNDGITIQVNDNNYYEGLTNIEHIAGAEVSIYTSKTCWDNETESEVCFVGSGTTDIEGKVSFSGILQNNTYVADIRGLDYHANWSTNVRDMEVQFTDLYSDEVISKNIRFNGAYFLSQPSKWLLTDIEDGQGQSIWSVVSDCGKDNYLIFNKDFTYEYLEGDNVCSESAESLGAFDQFYLDNPPTISGSLFTTPTSGVFTPSSMNLINENTLTAYVTVQNVGFTYIFTRQQ